MPIFSVSVQLQTKKQSTTTTFLGGISYAPFLYAL